ARGRIVARMRVFRYVVADVFTDTPLAGNPVAVFTDARGLSGEEMQRLARELNLSESVFVLPAEAGGHARIRIFTPGIEMQFAGHPTLGTAFVLAAPMQLIEIRLETGAGIVPVVLEREGPRIVFGRMAQPIPSWEPYEEEEALLRAVGVERSEPPVDALRTRRGHRRRNRASRSRRQRRHSRPRRVPPSDLTAATQKRCRTPVFVKGKSRRKCDFSSSGHGERFDRGQLGGEGTPEAAAVLGEVQAIAGRVDD